jgi:Ca2+-binding RTX toxin-like protein
MAVIEQQKIDDLKAGINQAFADIEGKLASVAFAEDLPILGTQMQAAYQASETALKHVTAIKDAAFVALNALNSLDEVDVEAALNGALSALGTTVDIVIAGDDVAMNFTSDKTYSFSQNLASDLGLGGLGITTDGTATASLHYAFDLTVGVDAGGFYVGTGAANELEVDLSLAVDDGSFGATLGFLSFDATDDNSSLTANFDVNLSDGDGKLRLSELGNNYLAATVQGAADINIHLAGDMGSAAFPSMSLDLNVDWDFTAGTQVNPNDDNSGFGLVPTVALNNVTYDLGSFFEDYVKPLVDTIEKILKPIDIALAVLNSDIKALKILPNWQSIFDKTGAVDGNLDVPDGKITLLDFLKLGNPGINLAPLIQTMQLVDEVIDWAAFLSGKSFAPESYNLGSFDLQGADIRAAAFLIEEALPRITNAAASLEATILGLEGPGWTENGDTGGEIFLSLIGSPHFAFPIIENPLSVIGLLLGKTVDLFELDLPDVEVGIANQQLASVSVFPGIDIKLFGGLSLALDLSMGFDTRGLNQFAQTGFTDYAAIINGFYLNDFDGNGDERPEVTFEVSLDLIVALNAIVAELGGGGGITGEIFFDLADSLWENKGTEDGRIYYDYLATQLASNAFGLFDTSGRITAGLTAYAKILGVEVWRGYSPRVTLGSFSFNGDPVVPGGSVPPPPIGLADKIGDTLYLNIGTRAGERDFGDITDDAESFDIGLSGGVAVAAFGKQEAFSGVTLIVADGGAQNDEIIVSETVNIATNLTGGSGDDTLVGGSGVDTLNGGADRDYLEGGEGDDFLYGQGENDILVGGAGADRLDGGAGIDIVSYMLSGAAVVIDLNAATQSGGDAQGDTLIDVEIVEGSAHADTMIGNANGNTFVGLGDNDELSGGGGGDVLAGNAGNDVLDGGTGADLMIGGMGDDTYHVDDAADDIRENYLNEIVGDGGHDTIIASIDYTLDHADRQDIEDLELTGAARIGFGNALANTITGTTGNDFLYGLAGQDHLVGGAGDDELYGGDQSDELEGGADDDLLDGGAAADTMTGGTGSDTYHVDDAGDVIVEIDGQGADTVIASVAYALAAGVSVELLMAAEGADGLDLTANEFDQVLIGSGGDDTLEGKGGVDNYFGGGGTDTVTYRSSSAGVTIDLELEVQQGGDAEGDTYVSIEVVEGSGHTDHLHGTLDGADKLRGINGHDFLYGYGGDDLLVGGSGDDVLDGGTGDDEMIGGAGNDTYYVDSLDDVVDEVLDSGSGVDHIIASLDYSISGNSGVENLTIVGDAREATGNGNANVITGTGFDDTIDGLTGGDTMIGGDGDDTYYFDSQGDTAIELADEGHDRIFLSIATYVQPSTVPNIPDPIAEFDMADVASNVEDLTVTDHNWRINIWGNDLDNHIVGNARNNVIRGRGGNDTIVAGGGADTIHGDQGNDTAIFTLGAPFADDVFYGGDGIDTLVMDWSAATNGIGYNGTSQHYHTYVDGFGTVHMGYSDVERWHLTGGVATDDLRGAALDDILIGGGGDDWLRGYAGKGTYHGGAGIDTVLDTTVASDVGKDFRLVLTENQAGEVVSNAGTDIETRWQGVEFVRIVTGAGNDLLDVRGTNANGVHFFTAGAGDDTFKIDLGSRGNHEFHGAQGTDTLVMDWSAATNGVGYNGTSQHYYTYVDGFGTVHVSYSGIERWHLTGGAGSDDLRGAALDDILIGNAGDDWMRGFTGKGTYRGGTGIDTVLDTTIADAGNVDLGLDFVLSLADNQLGEVVVNAGTEVETRWQGIEFVRLITGAGNDVLDVRGTNAVGQHVFNAGAGNDTFKVDLGSRGDHLFQGGSGVDTLVLDWSAATNGIGYNGTSQHYHTYVDGFGTVHMGYSDVERWHLTGGAGRDDLRGSTRDDILIGNAEGDWLRGFTGKGTYHGGAGQDVVFATIRTFEDQDLGLDFVLSLADTQVGEVIVNAGSEVETRWEGVEMVQLTTGSGNDTLDARGVTSSVNVTGQGILFDAGAGNDTFKIDLGTRADSVFIAGADTDTLVLDWSAATNNIGYNPTGYAGTNPHYHTYVDGFGTVHVNYSGVERWQLTGGTGHDDLRGGALDDILIGNGGNDALRGFTGKGTYNGGDGIDTVLDTTIASAAGKHFRLVLTENQAGEAVSNAGTDIETRWQGVEFVRIVTGAGNDLLDVRGTNAAGQHVFDAGAGDDTFKIDLGSRGDHLFQGGDGVDTLVLDWSGATNGIGLNSGSRHYHTYVDGFGTVHMSYSDVERWQLTGGAGGDDLRGAALDDILIGGGGNDALRGFAGKGTYNGGAGIDTVLDTTIASASGKDFRLVLSENQAGEVVSNAGTDIETRWQGVEFVRIATGAGNDLLDVRGTNANGQHIFDAGAGDDTFKVDLGSRGNHDFHGGDGTDTLVMDWSGATNGIGFNPGVPHYYVDVDGYGRIHLSYTSVERFQLTGGASNDDLQGGALDDILIGGGGNDLLRGFAGKGTYNGGAGIDTVLDTTIASASGKNFRLVLSENQAGEVVSNAGTDIETRWQGIEFLRITTGAGDDTFDVRGTNANGVQHVTAGAGDDTFKIDLGSRGNHEFHGGDGIDTLVMDWSAATNYIGHNPGSQHYFTDVNGYGRIHMSYSGIERWDLTGGAGDDGLQGGALDDILDGGDGGNDWLTGGQGDDLFVYRSGHDTVFDFSLADDQIHGVPLDGIETLAELLAFVDQANHTNAVFTFSDGNTLTLNGIDWEDLTLAHIYSDAPRIVSGGGAASISATIGENTTAVTTIEATHRTSIEYSIAGGADAALFEIDEDTGVLSFKTGPDFENPADANDDNQYVVVVKAANPADFFDTQTVTVTVEDVNEKPAITSNGGGATAAVSVAENTRAVTTIAVADPDAGDTRTFTLSGADASKFSISAAGVLTFKAAPDFEAPADTGANNVYNLTVTAKDGGNLIDTQALAVTVTNVNEKPEIVSSGIGPNGTRAVAENTTAVTTITSSDPDAGATKTFSLSGADAAMFKISSAGVLSFKSAPNFEAPTDAGKDNVYDVTVVVKDNGNLTDSTALKVSVGNVNEAPAITFNGGGASATIAVAENATAVTTVTSADPDAGATRTFSLSGADAAQFQISSAGVLSFKAAPNFEIPSDAGKNGVYDVTVTVKDNGNLTDSQALKVSVTDVNEAPVINSGKGAAKLALNLAENIATVTKVAAADDDKDVVTYSIAGGADAKLFAINAKTGALSFLAAPDFETRKDAGKNNVYDVIVKASDGTLSDTQSIAVTITDVKGKTLTGKAKAEKLNGTPEDDVLDGAGGNDTITGGAGKDRIIGGLGADTLDGGLDADSFVFTALGDSTTDPKKRDTITGFSQKEKDRIDLAAIDANTATAKDDKFAFLGAKAFTGKAGQLRFEKADGDTFVYGDVDGDLVADFAIRIDADIALKKADFVL